jgi:hypothetical protein
MTIYPVEFHRRSDQKWARRAQVSRVSETMRRLSGFVRPYYLQAPEPDREHLDGFPVGPSLSWNASACAGSGKKGRT